jgi:hypothetical protein
MTVAMVNVSGTPNRLDGDVDAEPISECEHLVLPVWVPRVDRVGRTEIVGPRQSGVVQIDGDDLGRTVEPCRHDGGEPNRSRPDHGYDIAGAYMPVLHTDLESGRQDVGEQDALGIAHSFGDLVHRVFCKWHPNELGLRPINHVAEDPPDPRHSLWVKAVTVDPFAAVGASAGADARKYDSVTDLQLRDPLTDLRDHTDSLMSQNAADFHLGHIPLEDMAIRATDGRGDHLHDDVGWQFDLRIRHFVPGLLARSFVHEGFHDGPSTVRLARLCIRLMAGDEALQPRLPTAEFAD